MGQEYGEACRQLARIRAGETPLGERTSVGEAAKRWLSTYVATARSPKNQLTTRAPLTCKASPLAELQAAGNSPRPVAP
jgi:hypothetical protein